MDACIAVYSTSETSPEADMILKITVIVRAHNPYILIYSPTLRKLYLCYSE